jgi:small subunit ribosomal protein S21
MRVEVRNGNVEKALKVLKKKLYDDGAIKTYMDRQYYEKPSTVRRRRKKEAINRTQKQKEKERRQWEQARMKQYR